MSFFDDGEETFLDGIPYPEALSRSVLYVGETWKPAANVQYVQNFFRDFEEERSEARAEEQEEIKTDIDKAGVTFSSVGGLSAFDNVDGETEPAFAPESGLNN